MVKLVMAPGYKLHVAIPLERLVKVEDPLTAAMNKAQETKGDKKGDKKGAGKAPAKDKKKKDESVAPTPKSGLVQPGQTYSHPVGNLFLEITLQRGDTDEEIERQYQIKLQQLAK